MFNSMCSLANEIRRKLKSEVGDLRREEIGLKIESSAGFEGNFDDSHQSYISESFTFI